MVADMVVIEDLDNVSFVEVGDVWGLTVLIAMYICHMVVVLN